VRYWSKMAIFSYTLAFDAPVTGVPVVTRNENLYSPHNSDSSSDKIDTKLYNKDNKNKLN